MELKKLYELADKENIDVIDFKMKNKAIIGCINDNYTIGINYSNIDDSCEEKCILAEELGHYYTNSFYNYNFSKEEIDKREFRATKWAFKTLIPFTILKQLYKKGCRYTCEFAEELGVTEDLVEKAYNYYSGGNNG